MLVGRKKKKESSQIEEQENPNNRHLLEYQNKCLVTMIDDLKSKLEEKSKYTSSLEKRIEALAEVFTRVSLEIYNVNETLDRVVSTNDSKNNTEEDILSVPLLMLSNILNDIQNNSNICLNSLSIHDQLKSLIDNISSNIVNVINNLMITIKEEKKIKTEIENSSSEKVGELLSNEYEILKKQNENIQKNYMMLFETNKNCLKELQISKGNNIILKDNLINREHKISELEKTKFNLTRKVNTNPLIPYINFERKLFGKVINEHCCICYVCGGDLDLVKKSEPATEKMEVESTDTNSEAESLKSKIKDLYEIIERMKIDSMITTEKLYNSKPYKLLLSQAEQLIVMIDTLKESNSELTRAKLDVVREKETEIKTLDFKYSEKINELEKVIMEYKVTIESQRNYISNCNLKIESLENVIKSRLNEDINCIFENYEKEKQNMLRQMESNRKQMKEYEKKFDEESKKSRLLQDKLDEFNNHANTNTNEIVTPSEKIDKKILKKLEQLKRLENELKSEKEYKETYIAELEVNEKGLLELNKKLKNFSNQIQENKEKIAKLTNEKIKDIDIFKRLNEEKDSMDTIIRGLEEKLKLQADINTKNMQEINNYKDLVIRYEQEIKLKEDDIEILKNELQKIAKSYEQLKLSNENAVLALKELEGISAKNAANYEHIKIKYEDLCKLKNLDTNKIWKSINEMEEEIHMLQLENNNYKNMLKCNICREKNKDSIVLKCFHMFCKECMDDTIKSRNRICPVCKAKNITINDVHSIFWD